MGLCVLVLGMAACAAPEVGTTTDSTDPPTTSTLAIETTGATPTTSTTTPVVPTSTTTEPVMTTTSTTLAVNPSPPTTADQPVPDDNQRPTVTIVEPKDLSSHVAELDEQTNRFGATLGFTADVTDPNGDEIVVEWFSSDEGFLGEGLSITATLHTGQFDSSQPVISCVATDQWGAIGEDAIQIIVWIPSDT